jgi:hypothetical protein
MNGHLLPSDEAWHADKALITELTPLIAQLSKYVMRYFDADAGQAEPISVEVERTLAEKVMALGAALQARADRREALGEQPLTVEGDRD